MEIMIEASNVLKARCTVFIFDIEISLTSHRVKSILKVLVRQKNDFLAKPKGKILKLLDFQKKTTTYQRGLLP